jgi:AraC family transcriptional regulator of adaptative response/methylated-DNA-[protein]-cysteine methyltransferase
MKPLRRTLPSDETMWRAFLDRDAAFDGVFLTGVKTTGIFCRTTCSARKPKRENVAYFANADEAMFAGFRACLRCKPMSRTSDKPDLIDPLVKLIEEKADGRIREGDLLTLGIDPSTARRQFKRYFGMTFQAYSRARRLGAALAVVREAKLTGKDRFVLDQQLDAGFDSPSGYREAFSRLFGTRPSKADGVAVMYSQWLDTPLGPMLVIADDAGIHVLDFVNRRGLEKEIGRLRARNKSVIVPGQHPYLEQASEEIGEYYDGRRQSFTLPLAWRGTPFQNSVWQQLLAIPSGETRAYADIAKAVGQPTAVRAVARANGDNYRAIVIPCHRVIGSDGALTGYGGGLARKQWLLDFEREFAGSAG